MPILTHPDTGARFPVVTDEQVAVWSRAGWVVDDDQSPVAAPTPDSQPDPVPIRDFGPLPVLARVNDPDTAPADVEPAPHPEPSPEPEAPADNPQPAARASRTKKKEQE